MAELADAHGSGPCDSNIMRVQVPFSAVERSIRQNRPLFSAMVARRGTHEM